MMAINVQVVVVVVVTSPLDAAYTGKKGQMPQSDEEFHQVFTILKHI